MEISLILSIEKEFQSIKTRYKKKYGAVIFDVKVKSLNNTLALKGVVLSEKQKKEVILAVKEIIKDDNVKNEIKVLSDPKNKLEIGWGIIKTEISDIWMKFPGKKKLGGRASTTPSLGGRATQALKGDFVRVLAANGIWLLVQNPDLAIGWIDSSEAVIGKKEKVKTGWAKIKKAKPQEIVKKHLTKIIQSKFLFFLKKYLNAPYLLGGMTEQGIDCSGLTEKFYSNIFGIMLPRHSGDQALCGGQIELSDAYFGDLVFLRSKAKKFAHIGVVVEKFERSRTKRRSFDGILILNARQETGSAAIEELSEILKSYSLISIRRIIKSV